MIIAISIAVGVFVAWLAGSSFFSDSGDLLEGIDGFIGLLGHRNYRKQQSAWEDDDHWIPGSVKFLFLLALSIGSGYMACRGLHALFG